GSVPAHSSRTLIKGRLPAAAKSTCASSCHPTWFGFLTKYFIEGAARFRNPLSVLNSSNPLFFLPAHIRLDEKRGNHRQIIEIRGAFFLLGEEVLPCTTRFTWTIVQLLRWRRKLCRPWSL